MFVKTLVENIKMKINIIKTYTVIPAILIVGIAITFIYLYQIRDHSGLHPVAVDAATITCDFYAAPTGTSAGTGAIGSPWDLQTALNKTAQVVAGKTLCLRGGTYNGKYTSALNGGTVTSAPDEWAKINGYRTTTLTAGITSSSTSLPVTDVSGFNPGQLLEVAVDDEVIRVFGQTSNSLTVYDRGASGGGAAAAHSSGATVALSGTGIILGGNNTTYQNFEVTSSDPVRDEAISTARTHGRGDGVVSTGNGNKIVNLVVHDNLDGIVTSSASSNTEVYGNIVYNNGTKLGTAGHGHGMYLENTTGFSHIYNNITFNSFNLGMQAFGQTAAYVGGDFQDNVYANSGSPLNNGTARNRNAVYGTNSQLIPSISIQRNHYYHQPGTSAFGPIIGYGAGITSATVSGNYVIGGANMLQIENTATVTGSGNKIYSATPDVGGYLEITVSNPGGSSWNNNTYYNANSTASLFARSSVTYSFANWKTTTGFDSSSTATSSAMPNQVIVIPNTYETGRANVVIYATAGGTTAQIDLSKTGLTNGQTYEIRNPQNYFGSVITSGTYNSSSPLLTVSLTGIAATVATPTGNGFTPSSTCPEFCPMVVLPTSGGSTPSDTTPPVRSAGSPSGSQPAGTTSLTLSLTTDETATCKYGTVSGTAYVSLPSTFSSTNSTSHSTNLSGLTNGTTYNYYVRCQDTSNNADTNDYPITFNVANPPSDSTPPTVSITAPSNGATVSGSNVSITANASDNVGVVGVQFKLDGSNLGTEDTTSTYGITWDTTSVSNGTHTLTATARDAAPNSTTSTGISVTVSNATPPSTVATPSIAPAGGSFTTIQSVTLSTTTAGASIFYTIDGATPTTSSTLYSGSISISSTTTVKALATHSGMTNSSVSSATFTKTSTPPSGGGGGGGGGGSSKPPTTPPTNTGIDRLINSNGTYYLIQSNQRKGVTSPGILFSCGFEFKNATTATATDNSLPQGGLLLPCGGALVKSNEDQTVYLVSAGKRYAFTSASVFSGLGFKFSSVLVVTNPELQALPRSTDVSNSSSAHLPETDINSSGTVYWIDTSGSKHPYPSLDVYNSWHRDDDFTTVVPANAADLSLTAGNVIPKRPLQ